jgi:hypothetical protein
VFTGVLAVSALTVMAAVTKKIAGSGRHGRVAIGARAGDTDPGRESAMGQLSAELEALREEVTGLRRELDEAQNRLDFTERVLAKGREKPRLLGGQEGG